MLSFLAAAPPRRSIASQNPIIQEQGASRTEFLKVPAKGDSSTSSSFDNDYGNLPIGAPIMRSVAKPGSLVHKPPYHWHKHQTETFRVHSGHFRATLNGKQSSHGAGAHVVIPPGTYHTLVNASNDEELDTTVMMDPAQPERDEAFFRNVFGYLDDCIAANMEPSLFQMSLFLYAFDVYLALPLLPPSIGRAISQPLVFFLGIVLGKWLLGLQESYPEYYKKASH